MHQLLYALEQRLLFFSKRAGINIFFGLVAAILVLAGLGFLSVGFWLWLASAVGTQGAALGLGLALVVLGALTLVLGTVRRRIPPPPPPPPAYSSPQTASIVALVEAFMIGMRAARPAPRDPEDD